MAVNWTPQVEQMWWVLIGKSCRIQNDRVIKTAFTDLLGVDHPIALAGMGGGTSPDLVVAVSKAGGLGILAASDAEAGKIRDLIAQIRDRTDKAFGVNLLLHGADDDQMRAVLDARPVVLSTAWPRDDQDLRAIFANAHDAGIKVMHMVPTAADGARAAEAGADVIVAQGTDGGGHIGLVGTAVVVPMVVHEVDPVPVLAAGVLVGTRFLATTESPLHERFKRAIVESEGDDTIVTDLADIMVGVDWPGAVERVARNRVVERWLGRANELRRRREEVQGRMRDARRGGDFDEAIVYWGQSAGLIKEIVPVAKVIADMVGEAESILRDRLPGLVVVK